MWMNSPNIHAANIYMNHIFNPSATNGPLGCFRVVGIINNAALSFRRHASFLTTAPISFDEYLGVDLLDVRQFHFASLRNL